MTQHWIDEGKAGIGVQAKDGGYFLVFDSKATEEAAYRELLSSPLYANLTVDAGMRLWSGADEPDTNEKLSDSGDGNKEPEPELTGLAKKAYDAVKGNMGAGMFALKNNPLLGGEELKKSLWDKFNIDDQQQDILKMKTANLSLPKDVTAYIKSRDEYIKKTDQEIDRFIDESMNTTDMSNPNNIANANAQLNYLYILRGRQNQSYIAFLDEAVNQHQDKLNTMVNEYTVALDAYNKAIESGQANYDKMSAALSDMYTTVQDAPNREAQARYMEAQIAAALGTTVSNATKAAEQTSFLTQSKKLEGYVWDSKHYVIPGTDLMQEVQRFINDGSGITTQNVIDTYLKGVQNYLSAQTDKDAFTGEGITVSKKNDVAKEAIQQLAYLMNAYAPNPDGTGGDPGGYLSAKNAMDDVGEYISNSTASLISSKSEQLMDAIKKLAPSGFLGIGKGTPPTLDKFIEIVTDETGDPLDESIARAIYAIFQRYLNDSGNTTKSPTWAVEAMLNNTSSPEGGTRLNPKTPTEFASFLGQELTINMMSDAINGINR